MRAAEAAIRADLAARYPDGALFLAAVSGRRVREPFLQLIKCGYTVNVNGFRHIYDHDGALLSTDGPKGGPARWRGVRGAS